MWLGNSSKRKQFGTSFINHDFTISDMGKFQSFPVYKGKKPNYIYEKEAVLDYCKKLRVNQGPLDMKDLNSNFKKLRRRMPGNIKFKPDGLVEVPSSDGREIHVIEAKYNREVDFAEGLTQLIQNVAYLENFATYDRIKMVLVSSKEKGSTQNFKNIMHFIKNCDADTSFIVNMKPKKAR
jgi:hypothetical protein